MDTAGARRLNYSSPSGLNSRARRTDFYLGLLEDQFRSGWFPLGNNVAKMPKGTEKPGLGMTIFRIRPVTMHAQASSYLGVVFEQIGLATWNGKCTGIKWRLNGKVPTGDELAGLLAARGETDR